MAFSIPESLQITQKIKFRGTINSRALANKKEILMIKIHIYFVGVDKRS